MIPIAALSLSLSGMLQDGITSVFQLFGQFVSYMINIPTAAWAYIAYVFSKNISQYKDMILPMLVIVLGVTFLIAYTIISTSETVDKSMNLEDLMGGIE